MEVKKNSRKRKVQFTNRKQSVKALISLSFGLICCFSCAAVLYMTYQNGGQARLNDGAVILVCLRNLDQLTNLVVLSVMLFNVLVIMAVPILRRKYPDIERPYKVWFYPVSVILVAAIFVGLFIQGAIEDPINGFVGFAVPVAGAIVYFIFDKRNKKEVGNE